jgi:hypothetical protein
MISAYVVAARLACHLDTVAGEQVGYAMPATGTAIQRRMGGNIFACSGVSIGITSVQSAPTPPNCDPWASYAVAAGIARTCSVEFNKQGQTLDREADAIAQTMSLDAAVLWQAFAHRAPLIVFEITGGLGITSATFNVDEFDVPQCAYPETTAVRLS